MVRDGNKKQLVVQDNNRRGPWCTWKQQGARTLHQLHQHKIWTSPHHTPIAKHTANNTSWHITSSPRGVHDSGLDANPLRFRPQEQTAVAAADVRELDHSLCLSTWCFSHPPDVVALWREGREGEGHNSGPPRHQNVLMTCWVHYYAELAHLKPLCLTKWWNTTTRHSPKRKM